ncbi:MAG: hypothetical protein KDB07_03330 [Planctomycetes bacterium]|nr:hypothetical protein [Planctomycetota bacterium]
MKSYAFLFVFVCTLILGLTACDRGSAPEDGAKTNQNEQVRYDNVILVKFHHDS